jgi:acyl-CoA reductase-like NAD-dependent aldehyde dehydrogenase
LHIEGATRSEWTVEVMKIQRSMDGESVRLALSGRIEGRHLAELQRLIEGDAAHHAIMLDLEDVRLVDREVVFFLARCEATGIRLGNCPAYVREWIAKAGNAPGNPSRDDPRQNAGAAKLARRLQSSDSNAPNNRRRSREEMMALDESFHQEASKGDDMHAKALATSHTAREDRGMTDFRLLINGRLVEGAGTLDVINPATGRVLTAAPRADRAQLEEAVAAAKTAFPAWSATPLRHRAALLLKLADALEAEQGPFARLVTEEQGKPLPQAMWEMGHSIAILRYFATLDLPTEVLKEDATRKVVRQYTPLGVVAAITPWNLPVLLLAIKVAPALLAGNTVVAKPAPTTPLTTLRFGELCARILPPGVVNVIVDQNDLGTPLTSHPDVAKVAFTGSTATGKKVMASAAGTVKRLTLELGGNDAAIVLDDADPKEVAPKIYDAAMVMSGQACIAIKRVYVHDSIYDAVCDELRRLARETVVGDGLAPGTQMGPIQNKAQFERVKGFLEDARRNGTIVAGGGVLERDGYFVQPTIVRDISDDARLVREEQFGPVLPVLRYSDIDDAIARANDTDFGLGGSVWSSDRERAFKVATRVNAGMVWVNKHLDVGLDTPFAGAKQSGLGVEMGQDGLEEFTQATTINVAK